ncbi:HlyD family secretion protein [Roseimaritima ulvae]|uniref:Putative multidrug resistance protein EmrK n=1 Tax=Roseimaritima ulvae TaxID=980254 RepID=A0A5B9QX01_9BACT|nr:HlyD family efflux transporter periplasmic adaptor subunit [Roseimaritima ulvae]QEG42532.1 putative multidrug resistance protein EmrK [Roseimaritima ulvae]
MKTLASVIVIMLIVGSAVVVSETHLGPTSPPSVSDLDRASQPAATATTMRAAGRIQGRTEEIELRAQLAEQVQRIHVAKGQWVSAGEILLTLDPSRLTAERDLAAAMLALAKAKKVRLQNGSRSTEIETARQEYQATMARLAGAQKAYDRNVELSRNDAVSKQTLDENHASLQSLQAMAAAAQGRLNTLLLPPREDELLAADAEIEAAQSRLQIAQINLDRTQIKAPSDGRILGLEAEVGELTGPDSPQPLIVMADTTQLRAVVEIDEFDALRVQLNQRCQITSDAAEGVLAHGEIAEMEPQMHPKRLFGQWAGERSDTYSRRIWVNLEDSVDLPIGLPVDVFIEAQ